MKLSPDMAQLIYKLQPKFKMMTTSEKKNPAKISKDKKKIALDLTDKNDKITRLTRIQKYN